MGAGSGGSVCVSHLAAGHKYQESRKRFGSVAISE